MINLNLHDVYLHVPIFQGHQKYLRFAIQTKNGIRRWQFRALPFVLSAALRIFTKMMAEVMAFLHLQGIANIPYLDNFQIFAQYIVPGFANCSQDPSEVGLKDQIMKNQIWYPLKLRNFWVTRFTLFQKILLAKEKGMTFVSSVQALKAAPPSMHTSDYAC